MKREGEQETKEKRKDGNMQLKSERERAS